MSQELINYLSEALEAVKDKKFSIFIREVQSRIRDYDIALTGYVLIPLEVDNTIKKDVQEKIVQIHLKKQALIELLEFFNEEILNKEIIDIREKIKEQDNDSNY